MKFYLMDKNNDKNKFCMGFKNYCGYSEKDSKFYIENSFFEVEATGDSLNEALLNLMERIESKVGITIYAELRAKENTWFDEYCDVIEYNGYRRITLTEYKEGVKHDMLLVRGWRTKQNESESPSVYMGDSYFDGESCPIDEFDVTFTTESIGE
jgi:hypothetical protein